MAPSAEQDAEAIPIAPLHIEGGPSDLPPGQGLQRYLQGVLKIQGLCPCGSLGGSKLPWMLLWLL